MGESLTLEEFYQRKFDHIPGCLKSGVGHFNVFNYRDFIGPEPKPVPYSRREYYKISFIQGKNRYHYADKTIDIDGAAIVFANPMVPYNWEPLDDQQSGHFCVFTEEFFGHFGSPKDYPMFQAANIPIYHIPENQRKGIENLYEQMLEELNSDYSYKYDLLKTLVIQLIHKAIKLKPAEASMYSNTTANDRISSLFTELLERQFPIESPVQKMKLRTPVEFASNLAIHTNHLNRALKSTLGKTTSQTIADRIWQEARILLKHTDWQVSQVGYCLGFEEASHFISFFKKREQVTPKTFRNIEWSMTQ